MLTSSKSRFLAWLLLCAPSLWTQEVRHLTILHSNDLHAHLLPDDGGMGGFAYLAAAVRKERAHCAACLYLNAGDLVQGTPVSTIYRGVPIYQIGNLLGFDAGVVGNHEFDYGWRAAQQFAKIARYPLLSANALYASEKPITGKSYVILSTAGIRVAVIGVVLGDLANGFSTPKLLGPVRVAPVLETVRRYARELRDRSDLIVVLGHIHDDTEVDAILREIPEVGVVIAGHSHRGYPEMRKSGNRVAVLVKGLGAELGRLDLEIDTASKLPRSAVWKKIPIDSNKIAPAPDVAREVAHWESKTTRIVDVEIGESKRFLDHDAVRTLIEQAMRDQTGADFAFMNAGGVRDVLPAGKLLARHIWNILPFDNLLVTGAFKGSQLPASVTRGRRVDPDRVYKLVVTDFTAANQEAASELNARGMQFPEQGPVMRDALIQWVRKKKVIE